MKIQHLAIIFVIIILPISMAISSYIQAQIDTISLQTSYTTRLHTATADSIKAFQLNTINNKYSTVSDSKIRDIEAAVSSFYNSLGTEFGATGYSSEELKPYIPAILFTMYDGYYIYSRYWNDTIGDYQYGLKPYIYYSCRYKNGNNYDFVVNYTLDNNITVYGEVQNKATGEKEYVTKTGALINPDSVTSPEIGEYTYTDLVGNEYKKTFAKSLIYDGVEIKPEILEEQLIIDGKKETFQYVVFSTRKVYRTNEKNAQGKYDYFWNNKNKKEIISDLATLKFVETMSDKDENLCSNSAVQYYYDAWEFSKWVQTNLSNITQEHAVDENGNKIQDFAIKTNANEKIFKFDDTNNNPILASSIFNQNRISVIRKTIQSNLASAIANFGAISDYEYAMPIFTETDWEDLVNNVSVAAFMQGVPIGGKIYNNYCIVTNDKNKEAVTSDSIYAIVDSNGDGKYDQEDEAHLPTCKELINNIDKNKTTKVIGAYRNIDFERQTVVENGQEYYFYPHANPRAYDCMVNIAEIYEVDDILRGEVYSYDKDTDTYIKENTNIKDSSLRKIYLTALAREKYDLYRTNAYFSENIIRIVNGQEVIGY